MLLTKREKNMKGHITESFEGRLWIFYKNIFCAIDRILSPSITNAGLSPIEARILFSVCESNEISVGQLSTDIRMNTGNCSTMCKKLEQKHLVRRYRSKEDERIVLLSPTKHGEAIVQKVLNDTHELHRSILDGLPEECTEEIIAGLDRIEAFFKTLRHIENNKKGDDA